MTESKIFADNYSITFNQPDDFLGFLKERKENSLWMTAPSKALQFQPLEKDTPMGNLYMQIYEHNGRAEILADTMENTSILLSVNGNDYPVRSCALKTILERARISGHRHKTERQKIIIDLLDDLQGRCSKWEIWQDFIVMSAISIANTIGGPHREQREKMYA